MPAAKGKTRTMSVVNKNRESGGKKLGPAVYTEVHVNGVPTRALVDTGSPATIISLDYVMDLLAAQRTPQQTPAQWEEETLKKFSPPEVALSAYGGQSLDVLSQIPLQLSQGDRVVKGVVLVQQDAPNDLLLGTDLQTPLGFALMMETVGSPVDLLRREELQTNSPSTPAERVAESTALTNSPSTPAERVAESTTPTNSPSIPAKRVAESTALTNSPSTPAERVAESTTPTNSPSIPAERVAESTALTNSPSTPAERVAESTALTNSPSTPAERVAESTTPTNSPSIPAKRVAESHTLSTGLAPCYSPQHGLERTRLHRSVLNTCAIAFSVAFLFTFHA